MNEQLKKSPPLPDCPAGKKDCVIIAEVVELRRDLAGLSDLVRTDTLTGIANYRAFLHALEQEIERTQRSNQPTSLIMLDIDFFKKVNDCWGHEIGNRALVHVARLIVQTVRKLDIPCRYGGEEFSIILPDTDLRASIPVAERIRRVIEATPMPVAQQTLHLTASLGIATYTNNQAITPEELIQQADFYLYRAKENGRNQVCSAEPPELDAVSVEEKQALSELFGGASKTKESS